MSFNKSPKSNDSLRPGIVTKVTNELLPSFIIFPELTSTLVKLSLPNVNSAAVNNGKYKVLSSPLINTVLLSLFLILTEILNLPFSPNTSFGLTSFPLNSYLIDIVTGNSLSLFP